MNAGPDQDGPIARLRPGGGTRIRPGRMRRPPMRRPADATVKRLTEWHEMGPAQRRTAWVDLVDWVVWLHDRYELSVEERLPACWAEHPGLIEELRALKIWREEIYGNTWGSTTDDDAHGAAGPASGQAARYWHAELRQVIQAATTFYAGGCRAGHRGATALAEADPDLRGRWLRADPLTGIPPALLSAPPNHRAVDSSSSGGDDSTEHPEWISDPMMRDALQRGQAQPLGELVTEFIWHDGTWWTPTTEPVPPDALHGRTADPSDPPTGWQRILDPVFSGELDRAADRMRAADALVAARRRAAQPSGEDA